MEKRGRRRKWVGVSMVVAMITIVSGAVFWRSISARVCPPPMLSAGDWNDVFLAGMETGKRLGMDLRAIRKVADRLPEPKRETFYDGAAHGIQWPFQDLGLCLTAIERDVPPEYREVVSFGPIQTMAQDPRFDAARINNWLAAMPEEIKRHGPKGVSVGIMRRFKHNPEEAVLLILGLSGPYHHECFEELGWWLGHNEGRRLARVESVILKIPERHRAAAWHGYIRGVDVNEDVAAVEILISRIDTQYIDEAYGALGWKIMQWSFGDPLRAQRFFDQIEQGYMAEVVRQEMGATAATSLNAEEDDTPRHAN